MLGLLAVSAYSIDRLILPLLEQETTKLVIRAGNAMVSDVNEKLVVAKTLAVSLASIVGQLPQDEALYKDLIPHIFNTAELKDFIAGGGVWPEPFLFDAKKARRSFFWGRNQNNVFDYYDDYNDPKGSGYHHEEWYVPTRYIKEDHIYWSKSYADSYSHQPMVTSSAPIYKNGQFYGVSTIDIKLEGIRELLKKHVESLGGYAFMLDRNGRFISFPEQDLNLDLYHNDEYITINDLAKQHSAYQQFEVVLEQINAEGKQTEKSILAENIAQESYQINSQEAQFIASIINDPLPETSNYFIRSFQIEQDAIYGAAATGMLFRMPGTHWTLGIVIPKHILFSSVANIIKKIAEYQLIAILVFVVAIFFILQWILRHLDINNHPSLLVFCPSSVL